MLAEETWCLNPVSCHSSKECPRVSGEAWPCRAEWLGLSHPDQSNAALLFLADGCPLVLRILKYGCSVVSCCPSLSQCPLPSVTALLLSRGTAGRSPNPTLSICVRCSGCAQQCVSCDLKLMSEKSRQSMSVAGVQCWGWDPLSYDGRKLPRAGPLCCGECESLCQYLCSFFPPAD